MLHIFYSSGGIVYLTQIVKMGDKESRKAFGECGVLGLDFLWYSWQWVHSSLSLQYGSSNGS